MFPKSAKDWNSFSKKMMIVSCVFIVIGGCFGAWTALFLRQAVPAKGKIIKLLERRDSENRVLYAPVFRFEDAHGDEYEISSSTASSPPIGRVGDTIAILYNPNNPNHAEENDFFNLWGPASISAGLGLFYLLLFWILAIFTKRRMSSAKGAASIK